MKKMKNDKSLIIGPSIDSKSSAAMEKRILKEKEEQRKQGHSIHPLYVDPLNGDEANEEK
ncbi:hypothetical protein P9027_30375 [Bacillus thuringiensis]|uniref:hypothetical protein n=1 Tax=Bacillus thuringiensis TaxID=1428 RepID=UPI002DB890B1|nr:hypothetical protein [Bacillus thuringiensis]MEC3226224.1 hypothetical protein [Bacillus thuringiensis]MEC3463574.1 hypothetical protein [Bacillus thuringiensis]MEC3556633.1 hypothetical protein [Bacillus thuringiensis]MED2055675.1 hypothetical protein [Bacillus thuringiensis]